MQRIFREDRHEIQKLPGCRSRSIFNIPSASNNLSNKTHQWRLEWVVVSGKNEIILPQKSRDFDQNNKN